MDYRSSTRKLVSSLSVLILVSLLTSGAFGQSWQLIAPMHFGRCAGAAITLNDGRVLVIGGHNGTAAIATCELYDPNSDTWTVTGSMIEPRYGFASVLLQDGRVFVAGGITGQVTTGVVATTSGCEIYDPKTGAWKSVSAMSESRENFPALLLPDGRVFLNGGLDANIPVYLALTEVFDPKTNSMKELAPMPIPYFGQIPFYDSLHNQVLIQGGSNGGLGGLYWNTTQVYDIASDTWSYGPTSIATHELFTNTELPDHSLLCLGGRTSSYVANDTIEILRPPYTKWELLGHLTSPRWKSSVVLVNDDSVLVIGGNNDPGVNTNVFDSTNWFVCSIAQTIQGPRMTQPRSFFFSSVTRAGGSCIDSVVVLVFGGLSLSGKVLNTCEKLVLRGNITTQNASLHREIAASYYGQPDSLRLMLDVKPALNIDSLWPTLHDISATYAWDSSVVSYESYVPPAGWSLRGLNVSGNAVDFSIHNMSSAATHPLDLGTAVFMPNAAQLTASIVTLADLSLKAGSQTITPCVSQNEDQHWTVKVLGAAGVSEDAAVDQSSAITSVSTSGDVLSVGYRVSGMGYRGDIVLYDLLGRSISSKEITAAGNTVSLAIRGLPSGVYVVRLTVGSTVSSLRFVLSRE